MYNYCQHQLHKCTHTGYKVNLNHQFFLNSSLNTVLRVCTLVLLVYALNEFKVTYHKIILIIDLKINILSIIKFQGLVAR